MRTGERGFTYLGLLGLLALLGAGLAALGTAWHSAAQREKERELQFRGQQVRQAIAAYWTAHRPHALPPTLQALLRDERGTPVRHHLRRLYPDPYTGRADWELLPGPGGQGIAGVRSRSDAPRWQRLGAVAADPRQPRVSDWRFAFAAPAPDEGENPSRNELPEETPP